MKIEIPEQAQMLVADQVAKKLGMPIGISDVKIVIDVANEVINNPRIAIETSLKCGGLMTLPYYLAYKSAGRDIDKLKQYLKGTENEKPTSVKDIFKKGLNHVKDEMKNAVDDVSDVVKTNINIIQKVVVKPKFWISLVRVISTSAADIPADVSLCMVMADAMKDEISDKAKMAAESLLTENTKITLTIGQIKRLIKESTQVNETVWEPKNQVGDLNLSDDEVRNDFATLKSRKVKDPITQNRDPDKIGRNLIVKYMGQEEIQNNAWYNDNSESYYVDKEDLRIAMAIQLRYNRARKSEYTPQDYQEFLNLFKSKTLPTRTGDVDFALNKEPRKFVEYLANNLEEVTGMRHIVANDYADYLRRNDKETEHNNTVKSIIETIKPQLDKFHESYMKRIQEYADWSYDWAKSHYDEYKEKYDSISHRYLYQGGWRDSGLKAIARNWEKVKWVAKTDKSKYTQEQMQMGEQAYNDNLNNICDKILEYNVDRNNLRVVFAAPDGQRAFQIEVTDGLHNLYARSIFAAEFSEYVKPHFRFIVTDKKSKITDLSAKDDTEEMKVNENTKITLTIKQIKQLVKESYDDEEVVNLHDLAVKNRFYNYYLNHLKTGDTYAKYCEESYIDVQIKLGDDGWEFAAELSHESCIYKNKDGTYCIAKIEQNDDGMYCAELVELDDDMVEKMHDLLGIE